MFATSMQSSCTYELRVLGNFGQSVGFGLKFVVLEFFGVCNYKLVTQQIGHNQNHFC